jgi:hypothetical protein
MPEVPNHVLELYKSGGMSTSDMDEFEALVESGELTLPSTAPMQIPDSAEMESIKSMLGDKQPSIQVQPEVSGESTTAAYQAPEVTPDIADLKPIGFESKGEQPWPTHLGNTPILPKNIFQQYQTRSLDFNTRMQVEEAINSGDYALPEGKTLNMPTPQSEKPLMERVSDVFSGADRKATLLPGVIEAPETIRQGPGYMLALSTAGPEERAKMMEGIGFTKSRDFFNNPVLTSPESGKKYTIQPGMDAADIAGGTAVAIPSVLAGMALAPVTAGYGLLAGLGIMGGTDVAIETAVQTGQKLYGGDFNKLDVAMAGALSAFGEAASAGVSMWGKRKIINTVKDAAQGDAKALKELGDMYKKDKDTIDIATEAINLKYNPSKNSFEDSLNFKESLKNLAENPESKESAERLAKLMPVEEESIEAFKKADIEGEMTIADIADRTDTETSGVVRSIYDEGTDSIKEASHTRAAKIKDTFIKKMESMGATKDKGLLSKNIKETMQKYVNKNKSTARVMYEDLKPVLKEGTADASETLASLKQLKDDWEIKVKDGEILLKEDKSNPFAAIEKEIQNTLSPVEVGAPASKMVDEMGRPLIEETTREVAPPLTRLRELRRKVGSMIKDSNIMKYEQYKSLDLNKMLKRDEARSVQKLEKKYPGTFEKWKDSDKLWEDAIDVESSVNDLFTKTLEASLFKDVGPQTKEMFEGGIGKMKVMLNSLPEGKRSSVLKASLLDAMGRNQDLMEIDKFGKWYNGFKDNSEGMGLLEEHLSKEEFSLFKAMGEAGSKIEGAEKYYPGGSIEKIRKDVGAKHNLIKNMATSIGTYLAGGSLASMLVSMSPAGMGATALSLAAIGAVRGLKKGVTEKKFSAFIGVLKSKEFLDMLANKDTLEVGVQKISRSKRMKRFAQLFLKGSDQKTIEQFIKNSLKSGIKTEQRLNEDADKDLQQPQP